MALPPNWMKHKNNRSKRYRKVKITQQIERKRGWTNVIKITGCYCGFWKLTSLTGFQTKFILVICNVWNKCWGDIFLKPPLPPQSNRYTLRSKTKQAMPKWCLVSFAQSEHTEKFINCTARQITPLENAQSLLNIPPSEHTINLVNGFDVSFTAYWLCRAPCANQDLYLSLESLRSG